MKDFRDFKFVSKSSQDIASCQAEFCDDAQLFQTLDSFNEKEQSSFNVFLRLANKYSVINPKQGTVAHFSGYCRETVNRKAKAWVKMGILKKKFIYNDACIYTLHPRFFDHDVRQRYSHIFNAFKTCALIFLFTFGRAQLYGDVTLKSPEIRFIKPGNGDIYTNVIRYTDSKREKRREWNMYGSEERKKTILDITKHLNLTQRGQVALSPYPAECLQYGLGILKTARTENVRSIWPWFMSLCNEWCKSNEVRPDFKTENDLIAQFGLLQESPKISSSASLQRNTEATSFKKRDGQKSSAPRKSWDGYEKVEDSPYVAAHKRGDALEAQGMNGAAEYDEARRVGRTPDYSTNGPAYRAAVNFARLSPDNVKSEWSEQYEKIPNKFDAPIIQVIKEWRLAQTKPLDIIVPQEQPNTDEPPFVDYGMMEETFDANEVEI